jgi:ABC-type multidrug transport system ATPase subunit
MRPTAGSATVAGLDIRDNARRVRRVVGLGIFPGVNDLDATTSIEAQVKTELILHHLPHDGKAVHRLLDRFGVGAKPSDEIGSLTRAEQILLGVGLGLLNKPRVLMVDGADLNLTSAERTEVWRALRGLGDAGITVLTACVEPPASKYADYFYRMGGAR